MKPRSPTLSRLPGSNIIDQTVGPKCLARRDAKAARQSCASNTGGLHLDVCPPVIARKCQLAVGMSHVLSRRDGTCCSCTTVASGRHAMPAR